MKSPTYFLKTILLIFGAGLLLFSGFTPIINTYTLDYVRNGSVQNFVGSTSGFHSLLWYSVVILTTILFGIGYFSNKTVNRILVVVLTPLLGLGILFVTFVFTFSIALDPGDVILEIGKGYNITLAGVLMVVAATIISVFRPKEKRERIESDLLDS